MIDESPSLQNSVTICNLTVGLPTTMHLVSLNGGNANVMFTTMERAQAGRIVESADCRLY